jgi:hypothetical protein
LEPVTTSGNFVLRCNQNKTHSTLVCPNPRQIEALLSAFRDTSVTAANDAIARTARQGVGLIQARQEPLIGLEMFDPASKVQKKETDSRAVSKRENLNFSRNSGVVKISDFPKLSLTPPPNHQ